MQAPLNSAQQSTYDAIFQHPLPRNLRWPDLHALLTQLATVVKGADGSLQITRNARKLFLPRPQRNLATAQEVMDLRRFLQDSDDIAPETPSPQPQHIDRESPKGP